MIVKSQFEIKYLRKLYNCIINVIIDLYKIYKIAIVVTNLW
jgi:hypothetical protein